MMECDPRDCPASPMLDKLFNGDSRQQRPNRKGSRPNRKGARPNRKGDRLNRQRAMPDSDYDSLDDPYWNNQ